MKTALLASVTLFFAAPCCLSEDAQHPGQAGTGGPSSGPTSGPTSRPAGGQPKVDPKPVPVDPGPALAGAPDHSAFDTLLKRRVRNELVDYKAIAKEDQAALSGYLDQMARVDVTKLNREQALAYYFNLYNSWMIQAVVNGLAKDPDWTPAANGFGVFKEKIVRTLKGTISLDDIENGIVRKEYTEPRLHVAFVCGARSCPPLLARAYLAKDLDAVLEANMKAFLKDDFRNPIDHGGKTLKLSQIFNWYKVDFGGDDGLLGYVNRYIDREVSGYGVEFVEYQWALNITPKSITTGGAAVAAPDHSAFDTLLKRRVRNELVDYKAIAKEDQAALSGYLDQMARVDVTKLNREQALAYYFNLYNSWMIQAVVNGLAKDPDWTPAANGFGVFKEKIVRTLEGTISLDDIENGIVRKEFTEPRLHVAFVCGARSCPPLLARAYLAKDLDAVLEANMKAFLKDDFRNPIDHGGKTLKLSQIFNWYKVDFGGDDGLLGYVNRYTDRDVSGYGVEFVEYQWALNITPE